MNQINADSISNVALAASSNEVSELADLETGVAYPAALSRSADGDVYLLRIGNRQPFAVPQQSIPAPLRQVIAQVMADTTSSLTNNTTTSTPSRAVSIPMQVTISATQQLQLNPLANVSMTPVQQLQVLQQLAGVSNRRTSWDLQLDKSTVTAKLASGDVAAGSGIAAPAPRATAALPAGASSAGMSAANGRNAQQAQSSLPAQAPQGDLVTVRLQASPTQWQVQWQPQAASAFQALSGASQQQILALVSEQLGGDSLQWAQLPEAFKRQLEQLSPALAKALAQSALPMKLNLDGQSAGLQPSTQQAVSLSANQFSALVPQQAVASPQSSVTISDAARAAMAKEIAAKDMAAALASTKTSNSAERGKLTAEKSTENATPAPRAATLPASNSQTPSAAGSAKTDKAPLVAALASESTHTPDAIDEQSRRVTSAKVQPAASQAQSLPEKPQAKSQLAASPAASPEPAAQTYDKKMSSTAGSSISAGQRMATQVASDRQPSAMSASSGFAASNLAEKVLANSAAHQSVVDDAAATQANSAADAKLTAKTQQAAATQTSSTVAPSKAQPDSPSNPSSQQATSIQRATSNQISAQNLNATVGHTATPKPSDTAKQHETLSHPTTPDVSATPEVSPAVSLNVLSKAELLRHLLQLLTPLWQAKQAEHAGSAMPPTALAELADPLSLPSGTAPHRPLLQQVQQSMLEPQLLSEARLQQELNAALLFNPLQPAMTSSAAGTLAVAMQLLLGRLGVPLPENHKSEKTQKLKDAIQQLELGQVRDTLKQLASHASAYQAAQLETLAQQKTEQNNWFFQLPLPFQGQSQFAELAVEQRAARKANGQTTALWHLTLALEVAPYGRVVMEGALGPDSNSLQFYTASSELKLKIEKYGVILRDRLKLQGVPIAQFQCTVGELPAHLAQKPSSLFQVKA